MNADTEITITLTLENLNIALASLGQQPFDKVADLIANIRAQAMKQLQLSAPAPAVTEDEGAAE